MKDILILPLLILAILLASCGGSPYVNALVDTTGAKATKTDQNGDGYPDEILVPSSAVTPILNADAINQKIAEEVNGKPVNATK